MPNDVDLLTSMSLLVGIAISMSIILSFHMQVSHANNELRQGLENLFRTVFVTTIAASIPWKVNCNQRCFLPQRAFRVKEVPPHDAAVGKAMNEDNEGLQTLGRVGLCGIGQVV